MFYRRRIIMEYTIRPNEILVKLDENHLYDIKEKIIVFNWPDTRRGIVVEIGKDNQSIIFKDNTILFKDNFIELSLNNSPYCVVNYSDLIAIIR